jgi:formate/nitrite transporter FocA (FNT family)
VFIKNILTNIYIFLSYPIKKHTRKVFLVIRSALLFFTIIGLERAIQMQ